MEKLAFALVVLLSLCASAETLESFMSTKVRLRTQWGAREPKSDITAEATKKRIAIHHTAGVAKSDDKIVKDIQKSHMDGRGWSDIAYHFLVGPDGKIFEGRSLDYMGAHVAGHNKETLGLNFLGCYDSVECVVPAYPAVASVTEAMIRSMGQLVGVLCAHYNIEVTNETVKGHRQFHGTKTACPGDRVLARMDDIRSIARGDAPNKQEL